MLQFILSHVSHPSLSHRRKHCRAINESFVQLLIPLNSSSYLYKAETSLRPLRALLHVAYVVSYFTCSARRLRRADRRRRAVIHRRYVRLVQSDRRSKSAVHLSCCRDLQRSGYSSH